MAPKLSLKRPAADTESPCAPKRAAPDLGQSIVNIRVGPNSISYAVHQKLACFHSDHLRAAFSGVWQEKAETGLILSEDDPDAFQKFLQYIYSGKIFTDAPASMEEWNLEIQGLINAYVLGAKLLVTNFQDAFIDVIVTTLQIRPGSELALLSTEHIETIYLKAPSIAS